WSASRQLEGDGSAFPRRTADAEGSSQKRGALPHTRQTEGKGLLSYRCYAKAGAIIRDAQPDILIGFPQRKVYMSGARMFGGVLQTLLSNPVNHLLDRHWQRFRSGGKPYPDVGLACL